MKLNDFDPIMTALGWTLLHSLWQGLFVFILCKILVHFFFTDAPPRVRYAIASGALILIVGLCCVTFLCIQTKVSTLTPAFTIRNATRVDPIHFNNPDVRQNFVIPITAWIDDHLSLILVGWLLGVFVFGVRLVTAWWSSSLLEKNAERIQGFWSQRVARLADDVGLKGKIILAQCRVITSPIVLGFLKPVILLPVGMLAGLSTEQIEAILLHELAHIRRHDYLINLLQSFTEVVLFFNPAVWLLSSEIRTTREECCDDIVVQLKNPVAYATALHRLEEGRVLGATLGLAAIGNKNQLLHRIKRIMKTSETKDQGSRKIFPALFVIIILMGCSWISVQARWPQSADAPDHRDSIVQDTSKKDIEKQKKAFRYSRKSTTAYDADGHPHEEITEELSNTDDERNLGGPSFGSTFDSLSSFEGFVNIPGMQEMTANFPMSNFLSDTLPASMRQGNEEEWEVFNQKLTERFQKQFGDFYKKNGPELQKMMTELESQMENLHANLDDIQRHTLDDQVTRAMRQAEDFSARARRSDFMEDENKRHSSDREQAQIELKFGDSNRERANAYRQRGRDDFRNEKARHNFADAGDAFRGMHYFQEVLQVELTKDGYLRHDEPIKTLDISDDGTITFNGKKVKDIDRKKYDDLRKAYLSEGHGRHVE